MKNLSAKISFGLQSEFNDSEREREASLPMFTSFYIHTVYKSTIMHSLISQIEFLLVWYKFNKTQRHLSFYISLSLSVYDNVKYGATSFHIGLCTAFIKLGYIF